MRNSLSHCFSEMEPLTFRIVAHIKLLPFVTLIPLNSVMLIMWLRWSSFTTPSCHLYLTILQMLFRSLSISLYILNFYFFENILKKKITSSHLRLRLPNSIYNRASCSYFYTFPLIFSSLLGVLYLYKMFWCSPLLYRISVCLLIAFGFCCTVHTQHTLYSTGTTERLMVNTCTAMCIRWDSQCVEDDEGKEN